MGVVTGVFQYANGSPVANGPYQWKLSGDAIEFSGTSACICPPLISGFTDSNGNLTSTFAFNDVLSTTAGATTYYQFTLKAQNGGQVWNEFYYLTGTAANLNIIPPAGIPIVITTPVGNILLQTNGVTNSVQTLENLVAGANVTLSNLAGATTITAAGGSGGAGTLAPAWIANWEGSPYPGAPNGVGYFSNQTANAVAVLMFRLYFSTSFNVLSFWTQGTSGSATVACGIYTPTAGSGSLLFQWAGICPVFNATRYAQSLTGGAHILAPGNYYWAYGCAIATTVQTQGSVPNEKSNAGDSPTNFSVIRGGMAANTMSAGVLPSTLGSLTAGYSNGNLDCALWIVEP